MNTLVKTFLAMALAVGAAGALLFGGEHTSGTVIGARMVNSGGRFGEFGGYAVLIVLIAALGGVVAWMLFAKTE